MSNNFMNTMAVVNSAAAASSAAEAAESSKKAQNAAEERLESGGKNPFVLLQHAVLVGVKTGKKSRAFFGLFEVEETKKKLKPKATYSIKKTDIAHMTEHQDEFGATYTKVYLEERSDLREYDDMMFLRVPGTLAETTAFVNKQ